MPKDIAFEKLKGRENYHTWQRSMLAFLRTKKLAKCIAEEPDTEEDEEKNAETMGWFVLAIEDHVANHFEDSSSPLEVWKLLKKSFSESGLDREVSALLDLTGIKFADCPSMDDYIGRTLDAWKRCKDADVKIEDRVVALLLLGKLGPEFQPLVMGLSASGAKITVESVKASLLSVVPSAVKVESAFLSGGSSSAHHGTRKKPFVSAKTKPRCFGCNQLGHFRRKCPVAGNDAGPPRRGESSGNGSPSAKFANAFSAFMEMETGDDWYIDSGASRHMTPRRDILVDYRKPPKPNVSIANSANLKVTGCGTAFLNVDGVEIVVQNVLCVPELAVNLFSVSQITKSNNSIVFNSSGCSVFNAQNKLLMKAVERDGVYKVEASKIHCRLAVSSDLVDWHRRLGHLGFSGMQKLKTSCDGLNYSGSKESLRGCVSCAEGKLARKAFAGAKTEINTTGLLELLHMDVCGPMETKSLGGAKYFLTIIDDFSRKVFVSFLTEKSAVVDVFRTFKAMVENECNRKIKRLRSDNGTEFVNSSMAKICSESGIVHETTVPYTPEHNGVAERMNRTIVEKAKCMLSDAELGKQFWGEAVHHAVWLVNRAVNRSVGKTPLEIWSGQRPNLAKLEMFGNRTMAHVPKNLRKKWDKKAVETIFVGYADTQSGVRCYDPSKRKVIVCRDVVFLDPKPAKVNEQFAVESSEDDADDSQPRSDDAAADITVQQRPVGGEAPEALEEKKAAAGTMRVGADDDVFDDALSDLKSDEEKPPTVDMLRRSERVRQREKKPVTYLATDREVNDPITPNDAMSSHNADEWKKAMQSELMSLDENRTWELVELPPGRSAIKTKWVFKTKRGDDGSVQRYKARLVAKGCSQTYGVDYTETYSPVVRYTSLRLLIAIAAQRRLNIDQMDAITAYLQGDLDEEIYTQQPDEFDDGSGRVCRLKKAMYGLKQSGRQWNKCLDDALQSFGLIKSKIDMCVYYTKHVDLIIAIYVDDLLIFWRDEDVRDNLKRRLEKRFKMKDLGRAKTCVGLSIHFEDDGISIGQPQYAKEILARFEMSNCKPVSTPVDISQKLTAAIPDNELLDVPYLEAVGSLLYLVQGTRPDLAFSVSYVSRFNLRHGAAHWTAVKRIFRYLRGTIDLRIKYTNDIDQIHGFVDADWAADVDERRSCSGWVFKLAGGAVSWLSKRQKTVALSTTEAEYMAMSSAAQEIEWLRQFLRQFCAVDGVTLHGDNQGAMDISRVEAFRQNTKHISIRHHFIREKVANGTIILKYVPTENNISDCLTKGVGSKKHTYCVANMGICAASLN